MAGNTFGDHFSITTFGESHGPGIGVVIDGCPPGIILDLEDIQLQLDRRKPGQSHLTTQRREPDKLEILSGVYEGRTLGTPIAVVIHNTDNRSKDYAKWQQLYRPSHADYTYHIKYGYRTPHGGGRASARETIGRVVAGAIAGQILKSDLGLEVIAWVDSIGTFQVNHEHTPPKSRAEVDQSIIRCPDPVVSDAMIALIEKVKKDGDSVGGTIAAIVRNVPPGLGTPVFDRLEAELAKACLSIPACKGFESGSGFEGSTQTGSSHNDLFYNDKNEESQYKALPQPPVDFKDIPDLKTYSNHSGGIQGGISNGMPVTFKLAFKPTATIHRNQQTVNEIGQPDTILPGGRHDPCVLPRAVPIVESMANLVFMNAYLCQRSQNPEWWLRYVKNRC